jgi:DNA polymerase I-like protein with 3'-5' exonuclease and polymerase domains
MTLDVETTHKEKINGGFTPLPYFGNKLVSVGFKYMGSITSYLCFNHSTQKPDYKGNEILQDSLRNVDVLIGHNIKFDISWLRDCGFVYNNHLYDTMVAEYILASSRRWSLGLDGYLKDGKTFYDIPYDIIEEYGRSDVEATEQVALKQLEAFGTTFEELFANEETIANSAFVA